MIPVIKITNLEKTFGGKRKRKKVIHDLTLSVGKGEVFGFIGPNGAGKSTTIKLILNFIRPDSGSIMVNGNQVGKEEYRYHIGYLSETPCLYDHLTAFETLQLVGRLSGMKEQEIARQASAALERLNLTHAAKQRAGSFSKGMKQRLGFATALIHDPDILILDEPMSGLDPVGRHQIRSLIHELKTQGKTVFFSSHILSDIADLCDQIGLIHKGYLLYNGPLMEFTKGADLETCFVKTIEEWDHAAAR
jgi:ABC-2 type transport system ATP-binding protein